MVYLWSPRQGECGSTSPCMLLSVSPSPTQWGNAVTRIVRINLPKHTYQPQWSEWLCNCTFRKFTAEKCSNRLSGMGLQRLQVKGAWVTALLTNLQYFLYKFNYRFLTRFFWFLAVTQRIWHAFYFVLSFLPWMPRVKATLRFTPIYNLKFSSADMADEHLATML